MPTEAKHEAWQKKFAELSYTSQPTTTSSPKEKFQTIAGDISVKCVYVQ